ncbi:hypothetical protein B0O99DRAFT_561587 [Bisporella sp. PMI_857]|nr:hypothetical protein B0O99DRAFT_561587 [Bisporella sp. PMI_857]
MASQYKSQYPSDVTIDPGIVQFFEQFYEASDTPGEHENYVENFTADATLILASKKSKGRNEIIETRKAMWEKVSARKHTVHKIFPFGNGAKEVMLYGIVKYNLKAGGTAEVDWAARAQLLEQSGGWKMEFYQVYLDTGATQQK